MTDQELRAMIRDSIARHAGGDARGGGAARLSGDAVRLEAETTSGSLRASAAFLRLPLPSGDQEGACLIEPAVRCNHCGYCLSLGH